MKVHNDLKELLFDFMNNYENYRLSRPHTIQQMVSDYCSNNSLALGKPEPLAKNKQFENVCSTFLSDSTTTSATKCKFCGKESWEH